MLRSTLLVLIFSFIVVTSGELEIATKSFSITSHVTYFTPSDRTYSASFQEAYSYEQKRAKIVYKRNVGKSSEETGTFILDVETSTSLVLDQFNTNCKFSSISEIESLLGKELFIENTGAPEYVVGPARLLFYVDKNKDKMRLSNDNVIFHNFPARQYYFEYRETVNSNPIEIYAYYKPESSFTAGNKLELLGVILAVKEAQYMTRVEFSFLNTIRENWNEQSIAQNVSIDPFSFNPFSGCSQTMITKQKLLFEKRNQETTRFSFYATIDYSYPSTESFSKEMFVAYDARMNSMRLDVVSARDSSGARKQIYNIHTNRVYQVMEKMQNSNGVLDWILDIGGREEVKKDEAFGDSMRCVVAEAGQYAARFSIGQLLVGADKFVYMGIGYVEGIKTRVYEATDVALPIWLEQPVSYTSKPENNQLRLRDPLKGAGKLPYEDRFDVLVHIVGEDERIVLIEIHTVDKKNLMTFGRYSIRLHDFSWELNNIPSNGDVGPDLFSLADHCSAGLGQNRYAKIELLLESKSGDLSKKSQLVEPNSRNLALQAALSDRLSIPSTMVYDMNSRLLKDVEHHKTLDRISLSFRVATHGSNMVKLTYLGQGRLDEPNLNGLYEIKMNSFQACYFAAAHSRTSLFFAYNPTTKYCAIRFSSNNFIMDTKGRYEIYTTSHELDIFAPKTDSNLFHTRDLFMLINWQVFLKGTGETAGEDVELIINKITVHKQDRKTVSGEKDIGDQFEISFKGYELIESMEGVRRILGPSASVYKFAPTDSDNSRQKMTSDQCKASCLSDFNCKSYSICTKGDEVDCLTSDVEFRSTDVAKQLTSGLSKARGKVKVKLDNSRDIELNRSPRCTLYNKYFLDIFEAPFRLEHTFYHQQLFPVSRVEECAELCYNTNIQMLRKDLKQAKESTSRISHNMNKDLKSMHNLWNEHKDVRYEMCDLFRYMDMSEFLNQSNEIQTRLKSQVLGEDKKKLDKAEGICIVGNPPVDVGLRNLPKELQSTNMKYEQIKTDTYMFNFMELYEQQDGIRISSSALTNKESEAYSSLKNNVLGNNVQLIKKKIDNGDNLQDEFYTDEINCARTCFLQRRGPWPACMSYDISLEFKNGGTYSLCRLNSVTLRQVVSTKREDLIIDHLVGKEIQIKHFEPRLGFVNDELQLDADLELARDGTKSRDKQSDEVKPSVSIRSFGICIIVIAGVICGAALGLFAGKQYQRRFGGPDLQSMMTPINPV